MSQITTHVLDIARGQPAEGVAVTLEQLQQGLWAELAIGITNSDGRIADLLPPDTVLPAGCYRLRFELEPYLLRHKHPLFYPGADIAFIIGGDGQHYHIPLLLSPYGYSTYRGS